MPPPDSETGRWFDEHVQPHEGMLRAWLRSRFQREADVDDVIQEAYVRLLRKRAETQVVSSKAFLFAVARPAPLSAPLPPPPHPR